MKRRGSRSKIRQMSGIGGTTPAHTNLNQGVVEAEVIREQNVPNQDNEAVRERNDEMTKQSSESGERARSYALPGLKQGNVPLARGSDSEMHWPASKFASGSGSEEHFYAARYANDPAENDGHSYEAQGFIHIKKDSKNPYYRTSSSTRYCSPEGRLSSSVDDVSWSSDGKYKLSQSSLDTQLDQSWYAKLSRSLDLGSRWASLEDRWDKYKWSVQELWGQFHERLSSSRGSNTVDESGRARGTYSVRASGMYSRVSGLLPENQDRREGREEYQPRNTFVLKFRPDDSDEDEDNDNGQKARGNQTVEGQRGDGGEESLLEPVSKNAMSALITLTVTLTGVFLLWPRRKRRSKKQGYNQGYNFINEVVASYWPQVKVLLRVLGIWLIWVGVSKLYGR